VAALVLELAPAEGVAWEACLAAQLFHCRFVSCQWCSSARRGPEAGSCADVLSNHPAS
jgi:hypothetical protein